MLAVAFPDIYGGCNAMTHRDAVVQPYQSDPESDPEGEAPEEVQTLRLQQDVSEWLVCLSLFICVVTVTTMLKQHSLQTLGHCSHRHCLQSAHVSRLFTVTTKLPLNIVPYWS